jgi:hypothetical protein
MDYVKLEENMSNDIVPEEGKFTNTVMSVKSPINK